LAAAIADALGPSGIGSIERCGSRLLIGLEDPTRISAAELDQLGFRGWVPVSGGVQIIIGSDADAVARALRSKLGPVA
jgi:phosphotransferase system IIB component